MKKYLVFLATALFAVSCSSDAELDDLTKGQNQNGPEEITTGYTRYTFDFENIPLNPDDSNPYAVDKKGSNFYSTYATPFVSYTDETTGLTFGMNKGSYYPGVIPETYEFYYGGIGLSTYNDDMDVTYDNQMSVYAGLDGIEGPGNGGSASFAVSFGHNFEATNSVAPYLIFKDNIGANFISMYVCNTVYARDVILNGNSYGEEGDANSLPNTKGYFYIEFIGHTTDGKTITEKYYLADYSGTSDLNGIRTGWNKVDLTSFKDVYKLEFNMGGSDNDEEYGLNTPAYFAFDDLVFEIANEEEN